MVVAVVVVVVVVVVGVVVGDVVVVGMAGDGAAAVAVAAAAVVAACDTPRAALSGGCEGARGESDVRLGTGGCGSAVCGEAGAAAVVDDDDDEECGTSVVGVGAIKALGRAAACALPGSGADMVQRLGVNQRRRQGTPLPCVRVVHPAIGLHT